MKLFEQPFYFLAFIATVLVLLFIFWLGKKIKKRLVSALFGKKAYLRLAKPDSLSLTKTIFLFAGIFFLFVALAKPQWGLEVIEAEGNFAQTVIAVDVSSSMRARDVQPDR